MSRYVIDLARLTPTQGFVIQGAAAGDYAGRSVAGAGDIDGDGFDDLIVGAPGSDGGGDNAGASYVLFGGDGGFGMVVGGREVIDLATLSGAEGFVIHGAEAEQAGYTAPSAGASVSAAGDIDGDGFADMLVAAPWALPTYAGFSYGEAYVVFGDAGGFGMSDGTGRQVIDLATLAPDQGFVMRGEPYDNIGRSVSDLGDINGDGFDDLIVNARGQFSVGYQPDEGRAYVLFGHAGGFGETDAAGRSLVDLTTLGPTEGFVIRGAHSFVGPSVSGAGDVDGDGFQDIVVGGPGDYNGAAYVLFGGVDGFGTTIAGRQVVSLRSLSPSQGFVIQGGVLEEAGSSVSSAGDVDGDGFDDLIIGASGSGGENVGVAYVLFGGADGFGTTIGDRQVVDLATLTGAHGFVIKSGFGPVRVDEVGDVNGDGFDDLIVGASGSGGENPGAAYVLFGGADGFGTTIGGRQVVDLATLDSAEGFVIEGVARAGVSAAGDVDGDGFDDMIVGFPGAGLTAGEAYVVFGGNFTGAVYRVGGEGDDVVRTGPTGRTIFGAQGDDTLLGNVGSDSLDGGSGEDSLDGAAANDTLAGGSGDDSAVGGFGDDRALGGDGNDTLSGRAGEDWLQGEANDDWLAGNAGDDSLDGGQGRDTLFGGTGNDMLLGGGRGDVLVGGEGADLLTGGSGFDRLVFGPGTSSIGASDIITDFAAGIDKVVIRAGTNHGSFLGADAFTGGGGIEVRWDAGLQQLQLDLNGDGTLDGADLVIVGPSLATLSAHDLLFV